MRDDLLLRTRGVDDRLGYAVDLLQAAASTVLLFHPIVVVDTQLVAIDADGELSVVEWARLDRGRIASYERQWFDVVNAEHFERYTAELTAWYSRIFDRMAKRT